MALNGAAAHAFVHILYKALLLMSAGSVLYVTGISKFNRLGGLFRTMPMTAAMCIIGALAISAFPLTSGFPAKSLIAESALEEHMPIVWYLIAAGSAGVLFVGIKLPWYIFFQKNSGLRPPEPPLSMRLAMYLVAVFCIGIGIFPAQFYSLLPFHTDFAALHGAARRLSAAVASLLRPGVLPGAALHQADRDDQSRHRLALASVHAGRRTLAARRGGMARLDVRGGAGLARIVAGFTRLTEPGALFARSWPTGIMAFWATLLLGAYVIIYYL